MMKTKARKKLHERVVRTSISMPPIIYSAGIERQHKRGYPCFSDYLQNLIRQDALVMP
jgi:hypothetical protein